MRTYSRFSEEERNLLYQGLQKGMTQADIAEALHRHPSTISQELKRNGTSLGYLPDSAQKAAKERRKTCCRKPKLSDPDLLGRVLQGLQDGWSPEQISGRLHLEDGRARISHETLYHFIYETPTGKRLELWQYLRQGKKHRTHHHGRGAHTSPIAGRLFIESRPAEANRRLRVGDWETDSLLFAHQGAANVLTERFSRFVRVALLGDRGAEETARVLQKQLAGLPVTSITADNGPEFARHEAVSRALNVPFYFCHRYASWEKGTVENTNGLIRRYLPRKTDLSQLTQQDLEEIADELNHRPRKVLGYRTPFEVLLQNGVALGIRI